MNGTIKKILHEKRCGFIRGENGTDYFFHQSGLKNCQLEDLHVNQDVTFEDNDGEKGPRAEDVFI